MVRSLTGESICKLVVGSIMCQGMQERELNCHELPLGQWIQDLGDLILETVWQKTPEFATQNAGRTNVLLQI
jgi:hypothetical protein